MQSLSQTVNRKFIETFDVSEWEVECEDGYVDVLSSNKTITYEIYRIECENGLSLECADNHILIDENHDEIFSKDSLGYNILTKYGTSKVISVEATGAYENMYDLSVDSKEHTYYTNDILSHNTTTSVAYILWYTLFQDHKNVAILANKSSTARGILSRYQMMYENLPKWMQQGVVNWNKGDVELENNSRIFTAATTAAGIRSQSVNLLYIDEAAIIPNTVADQFFTSVYPVVSAGQTTKIIITSTPLGYNHFWKFWNDATNGNNDFVPLFIPYYEIPGRDDKWLEEQKRQLGELKFNQEVLCNFLGSSLTLVSGEAISKMSITHPIYSNGQGLDIYENVDPTHIYVTCVDTAKGVGGDASAFCIIDITTVPYKIVAKYKSNEVSPLLLPNIIYEVSKAYNDSYVLVELNTNEQVPHILHYELEYDNVVWTMKDKGMQTISAGFKKQMKPGVTMDKKVKRIGCHNLKSLIETQKLLITDADIISELSTFIEKRGSFEADEGYHDDLVMSLVIFAWLITTKYFKEINTVDLRKALYEEKMRQIEEDMLPFGIVDNGLPPPDVVETAEFDKFLLNMD